MALNRLFARLTGGGQEAPKDSAAGSTSALPSRDEVVRTLCVQISEMSKRRFKPDQVDPSADMYERGYLDSMSYVDLLLFIEKTYKIAIFDDDIARNLGSLDKVADHIVQVATTSRA